MDPDALVGFSEEPGEQPVFSVRPVVRCGGLTKALDLAVPEHCGLGGHLWGCLEGCADIAVGCRALVHEWYWGCCRCRGKQLQHHGGLTILFRGPCAPPKIPPFVVCVNEGTIETAETAESMPGGGVISLKNTGAAYAYSKKIYNCKAHDDGANA